METEQDPIYPVAFHKPFLAYAASNPQLRADGLSEDEAVDKLMQHVLSHAKDKNVKSVKVREMSFDELVVQQAVEP